MEGSLSREALPIGTVITISAAGSEGSPDSVIAKKKECSKEGQPEKHSVQKFHDHEPGTYTRHFRHIRQLAELQILWHICMERYLIIPKK